MKPQLLASLLYTATGDEIVLEVLFIEIARVFAHLEDSDFETVSSRMMKRRKEIRRNLPSEPISEEALARQLYDNGARLEILFDVVAEIHAHLYQAEKKDVLNEMNAVKEMLLEHRADQPLLISDEELDEWLQNNSN